MTSDLTEPIVVQEPAASEPADPPKGPLHYLWQTVSWILLVAGFGILFAAIVVPKVSGGRPYTVLTGSMRPDYPPGTLIVVRPRPAEQIGVGDVITYQLRSGEPAVVTHRVVEVTRNEQGELRFVTKGDDNNVVDEPPVRPVQVRGVLWYSIPYLGWVNTWFSGKRRTMTVFVLAGLCFALSAWEFYMGYREDHAEPDDQPPADDTATETFPAVADATEPIAAAATEPIPAEDAATQEPATTDEDATEPAAPDDSATTESATAESAT